MGFHTNTDLTRILNRNINLTRILNTKITIAIVVGLFVLSISVNESFASSSEREVDFGLNTLIYRDISSTSPTPEPTISADKNMYHVGEVVTLTLNDFNANLDTTVAETTVVTINFNNGNTIDVDLIETDISSAMFVGTFTFQSGFTIFYTPDPPESPRVSVDLDVEEGGIAVLGDEIILDEDLPNMCFDPVTHAFQLTASDPSNVVTSITMSYANAVDPYDDDPLLLQMYYKGDPTGQSWRVIAPSFFSSPSSPLSFNFEEKTITNNPLAASEVGGYADPLGEGQYILGVETSCGGGGGGGLIRPGLVLNMLAGINFGSGGLDRSPPSLNYGTPTNSEDSFGGILVTDDNNSFPLVINGKGYYLPEFSTTIEPVQVNTGEDVDLTLTFLENTGVEHVAIHFVNENNDEISDTDAVITYHKGDVTKVDPEGILSDDITFTQTKEGNKYSFNFGTSFDEPGIRNIIVIAWDNLLNSGQTKVFNGLSVSGNSIPDDNTNHMIYLDLGAYFITANGIFTAGEKPDAVGQPVIEFDYPDSVGRMERHDGIIYDQIADEKARANQVMAEKFNIDTQTFVANDEVKPYDPSRRASELYLSSVGHKIRDFTLSPEENEKLIKELTWKEHLKAQKILDSMLVSTKYHK